MQETDPTILITGFEPFGPPGRPKRKENASETVLRAFQASQGHRHRYAVLPVDPRSEVVLARALQTRPSGIVAMGEAGLEGDWDTNVEPAAWDRPVRPKSDREEGSGRFLVSSFAEDLPLLDGMDRRPRIGSYWCNRIYWRVLEWNLVHGIPAVFLHLRVGGDRERQRTHLEHAVAQMAKALVTSRS